MTESVSTSEEFITDDLDDFEPTGVLSYTPLMRKLEQDGYAEEDRKQIAVGYFSFALFIAQQDMRS